MVELTGKVAVVTGASRGMGHAFVEALVAEGARVACLARPSADLDRLALRNGKAVEAIGCDVGRVEQVDTAIAEVVKRFGGIDVLVNNAAIYEPFLLEEAMPAQVEAHVAVNLLGPIWLARAAIPHLRATRGHIVSISSESVRMPFPYLTVYAATKGAVEVLSAGLRDELREHGIRVTVLRSGSITSSTGDRAWDQNVSNRFFAAIQRSGHAAFTGNAADPRSMAATLVALLKLPTDVNIDLIEARGAGALTTGSPMNGPA